MISSTRKWTLVLLNGGKQIGSFEVADGESTIGREASNQIVLQDASVSRCHAKLVWSHEGLSVQDLNSRNGIKVNGVPRQTASLQSGDRLEVGTYAFEVNTAPATPDTSQLLRQVPQAVVAVKQTIDHEMQLPEPRQERELTTLYHVCFWVTEGFEEDAFVPRCLRLMLQSFRVQEVQLYSADRQLECSVSENGEKPSVKLADFLAARFQSTPEAMVIPGAEIARHQQKVGAFNYLIGPLRIAKSPEKEPRFLVLLRPTDWVPFTAEDRVLLQAVCRLWIRRQAQAQQVRELRDENALLKQKVGASTLLGGSAVMDKLREKAIRAAAMNVKVLIKGETGSGKEEVAQCIHENSARKSRPFIRLNCAAIPDTLIESELFGHRKGAFTGADRDRTGKFVLANGGTLFLDEIGEMPLSAQGKVLRAIENGEVEPVGADVITKVDVRLLAATNRDLDEWIKVGRFREDLYYRLNEFTVRVPPLREHLDDLETLASHFLEKFCAEQGLGDKSFTPEALGVLKQHHWPGNVRELRNIVHRCGGSCQQPLITAANVAEQMEELRVGT